jgi:ABC-type glycerol-3-phosphate transport system substrate-binding protein
MRKHTVFVCVLLMAFMALSAWAAPAPLKITAVWGYWNDPTPPVDRALTDYANKLIVDKTGVQVEWPLLPSDWTGDQLLTNTMAAGNLPQIIDAYAIFMEPLSGQMISKQKLSYDLTADMIKKNMPNYTARVQKYGRTVEEILKANLFDGRNQYLPIAFGFASFPKLADFPGAKEPGSDYYAIGFRDDILKKIFPNARSEAEQQALLVKKGSLTIDDVIGDIPIKNLDDLYNYLKAVKALNLKVGDKPVIPGAISASSESMGALDWSLRTIVGYFWNYPMMRGDPPDWDKTVLPKISPEYKEYMKWWNKLYNEGLVDPEMFVMKNSQFNAKQINGEYAVLNRWWSINDARKTGKDRNYGYRYFPVFYGQAKDIWDNNVQAVSLQGNPLTFMKSIKQADLPKVMKWADWYMGEERDSLAYWGMPEWYTGTGKDRRYTWQYRALEDWAVYGILSSRDGAYYGVEYTKAINYDPIKAVKFPLGPISFFADSVTYPEAPFYVYNKDPQKVLKTMDLWAYSEKIVRAARYDQLKIFYTGSSYYTEINNLPEGVAYEAAFSANQQKYDKLLLDMVTGPSASFEKSYAAWNQFFHDVGIDKYREALITFMKDKYPKEIAPNIFVDKTKK